MPLQATAGAATYDAFGGGLTAANYIEDVFQTWLYTGNGSTQTVTNGIDLAGKGGLVWTKMRNSNVRHVFIDSSRGNFEISSDSTAAQSSNSDVAFTATGYNLSNNTGGVNNNTNTFVSWSFRKQPKFFDVVTYTGDGNPGRTVAHGLGSVPGCIIVKRTDGAANWGVYHRSLGSTQVLNLNSANNAAVIPSPSSYWNNTSPTGTVFTVGDNLAVNTLGGTYVAYLFAHDAGGFGASGTDNVISCGSYTGNGSATGPTVTLNYEPQWLMVKNSSGTGNWNIIDNMRGMPVGSADAYLEANTSDAEASTEWVSPTATGFQITSTSSEVNNNASTYIYIAIRRGPMRTPTSGTSVFSPSTFSTASGNTQLISSPEAIDMGLLVHAPVNGVHYVATRLIGNSATLQTQSANAESNTLTAVPTPTSENAFTSSMFFRIEGSNQTNWNSTGSGTNCFYGFRRAPGFFDVVCYTGTGSATTFSHNLGVVPEMMIVKRRDTAADWWVYDAATGNTKYQVLNSTATPTTSSTAWNNTTPTSSVFSVGTGTPVNASAGTYVAYLFATVAGVSKVGSYTGTGTTLQVNCGFTAGSRFVLIKRTDSTGDWYVWDSARGIVASTDPYLVLNSTAAEVTSTDYVDTFSSGFEISSTAPAAINANGGTFIFLAIS